VSHTAVVSGQERFQLGFAEPIWLYVGGGLRTPCSGPSPSVLASRPCGTEKVAHEAGSEPESAKWDFVRAGGREAAELPTARPPRFLTSLEYPRGRTECPTGGDSRMAGFRAGRP
jgi:hypothetical protein